jgi:hypothetical protein
LRDKNKGLRVPQDILDLEYKYNKEFRELNAQVRDKTGMGTKRKREADPVAPKATQSKSKSADAAAPGPRAPSVKTKSDPTLDVVPTKKPRNKHTDTVETAKPRTKQTAKKTTPLAGEQRMDWMGVDVKSHVEASKPRTKQTARKTTQPKDEPMDIDLKPGTKQTAKKAIKPEDLDDLDEPHAPRTKTTARRTAPVPAGAVASSSSMAAPPGRPKQTARRGKPFPGLPARSSAPRADSISGHWTIDCPAISEQWDYMDNFSLSVIGRGTTLEGEFDLGLISGLLRSDRIEQRGPNGAYATVYWAGQENEGPVCTPNAGRSGYIKFTGDRLKGRLNNVPACGDVEFEGQWVSDASLITASWDDYNEDAYERANRARWGNRWGGGWSG